MAAGAWVFPLGIVGFVAFLFSFLAANPATPASFLVVQAGDTITYEETLLYDDGLVAWSTREDLQESDQVRHSPYGLVTRPREMRVTLASNATNITDPVHAFLVGKHANETVRTEPKDNYFGDWEENATVDRTIAELPAVVTILTGQQIRGRVFNATEYAESQMDTLGRPLRAGDEVPCDFGVCRIESIDADHVTYRQFVTDGATLPVDQFIPFAQGDARPLSRFELRTLANDSFAIRWAPVQDDAFILRSRFGDFPPGYYRFDSFTEEELTVRYRGTEALWRGELVPAHLLGERAWFELVVTRIE